MSRQKIQTTPEPQKVPVTQSQAKLTKQAQVIALLEEGTTVHAIQQVTGWQKHSVHGFISGTVKKKLGLNVVSEKGELDRIYRIGA